MEAYFCLKKEKRHEQSYIEANQKEPALASFQVPIYRKRIQFKQELVDVLHVVFCRAATLVLGLYALA